MYGYKQQIYDAGGVWQSGQAPPCLFPCLIDFHPVLPYNILMDCWGKCVKSVIRKGFVMKITRMKVISCLTGFCVCVLCLSAFSIHADSSRKNTAPGQDNDGYYLLCTKEDFEWFISTVRQGDTEINVRLKNDLILNDTSNWENWADIPPENKFNPMIDYNGHFDGGGYALEGYYSNYKGSWQAFIFTNLEENARITNLHIRNSFFRTSFEDSSYEDDDGRTDVAAASVLCFSNEGVIEGCDVHARVMGAWNAGGIVGINYGQIRDCHFSGSVEAGLAEETERPENGMSVSTLFAGGICYSNRGTIHNCKNDGKITLGSLAENYYLNYAAGGIAGKNATEGMMEESENAGDVECVQLAGGIAGANWGRIARCTNSGDVLVSQADREYTESLISAGICASNGGVIDTCLQKGSAAITQTSLSFYAPVYGIACNTVNPDKGTITNCYYLKEHTNQVYRQSGVYKLSSDDTADFPAYLAGDKKIEDKDTWELMEILPDYPGTDEDDYIRLGFGPAEDVHYEVEEGDNLWSIAAAYYGNGSFYELLERDRKTGADTPLIPGEQITIPHREYYLLRANDEEGHGWSYCELPSGESCPTHFIAAKPIDWYYGSMHFEAGLGFDVMWPKEKEQGRDVPAADVRILYRMDGNPDGDFFADWETAKQSICQSAETWCGDAIDSLRFYCYTLDNGENLYGFSFRLHRQTDTVKCAAFYRVRDGFLAEYVGIEPAEEDWNVLERARYLAAEIDNALITSEVQSDCEEFYGKENWDFPLLHNPFAAALCYSKDAECSSYMLFTGAQ